MVILNYMVWMGRCLVTYEASHLLQTVCDLELFLDVDVNDLHDRPERSGCIGKKGIGWKSTFAVSNCPHAARVI